MPLGGCEPIRNYLDIVIGAVHQDPKSGVISLQVCNGRAQEPLISLLVVDANLLETKLANSIVIGAVPAFEIWCYIVASLK